MCSYGGCKPTCENCKPKFLICPHCGKKTYLYLDTCTFCQAAISEEMKEAARKSWQASKQQAEKQA